MKDIKIYSIALFKEGMIGLLWKKEIIALNIFYIFRNKHIRIMMQCFLIFGQSSFGIAIFSIGRKLQSISLFPHMFPILREWTIKVWRWFSKQTIIPFSLRIKHQDVCVLYITFLFSFNTLHRPNLFLSIAP